MTPIKLILTVYGLVGLAGLAAILLAVAAVRLTLRDKERTWRYSEPTSPTDSTPVVHIITDPEILREYFPHWKGEMERAGKAHLISEELCIEDWVMVHWAEEVKEDD